MSAFRITPSAAQVNEGDSLTTSLSGFTPGSTVYFKVGGRGISKKDFAAGGVKGRVQVDANGVATISHTLRADKATEGDESFRIQVFSDKKMKKLVGQSDAVGVGDTSVKAPKGNGQGGGKEDGTKDRVTGLHMEWYWDNPSKRVRYNSDKIISFKKEESLMLKAGIPYIHDDSVVKGQREYEMSPKYLVETWTDKRDDGTINTGRSVLTGTFKYNKDGKLISAKTTSHAQEYFQITSGHYSGRHKFISGFIYKVNGSGISLSNASSLKEWEKVMTSRNFKIDANYEYDAIPKSYSTGGPADRNALTRFGEGRFFQEGWWNNPFIPDLV